MIHSNIYYDPSIHLSYDGCVARGQRLHIISFSAFFCFFLSQPGCLLVSMNVRPSEGQFSKPIRTLCARRFSWISSRGEISPIRIARQKKILHARALTCHRYPTPVLELPSAGLVIVCEMPILYGVVSVSGEISDLVSLITARNEMKLDWESQGLQTLDSEGLLYWPGVLSAGMH
jgi:hypothetical protein